MLNIYHHWQYVMLMPCETMAQAVERTGKVYAYAENCCYMCDVLNG